MEAATLSPLTDSNITAAWQLRHPGSHHTPDKRQAVRPKGCWFVSEIWGFFYSFCLLIKAILQVSDLSSRVLQFKLSLWLFFNYSSINTLLRTASCYLEWRRGELHLGLISLTFSGSRTSPVLKIQHATAREVKNRSITLMGERGKVMKRKGGRYREANRLALWPLRVHKGHPPSRNCLPWPEHFTVSIDPLIVSVTLPGRRVGKED